MNPIYNAGIALYSLAVRTAAMRSRKPRLMVQGHKATMASVEDLRKRIGSRKLVWLHAASLGEFEQGRPLIERLRQHNPDLAILLTFFSPSGYEVRKNYPAVDCVCYLPFDTPANARRFVEAVRPDLVIFVKYEFWGNILHQLKRLDIPTILISSIFRSTQAFFKPWGGMFRDMLRCYTHLFVQDENSQRLLAGIGLTNVTVAGDTRFDRVSDTLRNAAPVEPIADWLDKDPDSIRLVVGSSWQPDEDIYIPWLLNHPNVRAIIAPHEFSDERLSKLIKRLGEDKTILYSTVKAHDGVIPDGIRYVIIDCFGLLASIYRYASIAYIGGGFGAGIHNLTEAAVYGVPVIFGPRHQKFREASGIISAGGGFSISSADEFADITDSLVCDNMYRAKAGNAAGNYISSHLGATDLIETYLCDNFSTIGINHKSSQE